MKLDIDDKPMKRIAASGNYKVASKIKPSIKSAFKNKIAKLYSAMGPKKFK